MNTPNPLRRVLAATDGSPAARHACERAAQLAATHGAPLTLLHSAGSSPLAELREWLGHGSAAEQSVLREAADRLAALGQALAQSTGVALTPRVTTGSPVADICAAARDEAADLVVLGRVGTRFWHRLALGSTAERVVSRCGTPVLAVAHGSHGPYQRVLVPVDFSAVSRAALACVRQLAPQAHVLLVHASDAAFHQRLQLAGVDAQVLARYRDEATRGAQGTLLRLAAEAGLSEGLWSAHVAEGDPAFAIVEQEQLHDCDLIVIGKQGRHRIDEFLLGSVTRHVLAEAQGDVLVVPAPSLTG